MVVNVQNFGYGYEHILSSESIKVEWNLCCMQKPQSGWAASSVHLTAGLV